MHGVRCAWGTAWRSCPRVSCGAPIRGMTRWRVGISWRGSIGRCAMPARTRGSSLGPPSSSPRRRARRTPRRLFSPTAGTGETSVIAGRAGVNDLWQAIEVGAFAPEMPRGDRRAVIFVSMQWFMCYRDPSSTFPGVFSQGAYDAFMGNEAISDDVKSRVAERVRAYGVPDAEVSGEGPARPGDQRHRPGRVLAGVRCALGRLAALEGRASGAGPHRGRLAHADGPRPRGARWGCRRPRRPRFIDGFRARLAGP